MAASDYTIQDIYSDYCRTIEEIDKQLFTNLCNEFNQKVMDEIVYKGREMNMGSYMSTIQVVKVDRNYSKPVVNWHASNKLKEELLAEGKELYSEDNPDGHKWLVYHTDKWYIKFHWHKHKCKVKNKSVYRFRTTRGKKGNKTKLKDLLNSDSLAHLKYRKI